MNSVATAPGPASVVALGAASCGTVAWRVKGELRLTVMVKASFDLVPGGPMTAAPPEDIAWVEAHHRNAPTQSVRLTTDLAPFLPAADVVLTGHAHAPAGAPAQALTVRFAVFRERALVEKLIHVYGDRVTRKDSIPPGVAAPAAPAAGAEVTPFEQMPLVYERAFGGLGHRDNPFGTGVGANDRAPNLLDPQDAKQPSCFAPISAGLPSRKRMLDKAQREGLKQPIVDITGDLSFQYFHAAPPDQRVPQFLMGNEWVVLDGMHPTERSVQSRLPDAVAAARVYGLDGLGDADFREVALVADTLRVDADRMTCSLTWRGHVPVPDEATLARLAVVGGVALGDQPIVWPVRLEEDLLADETTSALPPRRRRRRSSRPAPARARQGAARRHHERHARGRAAGPRPPAAPLRHGERLRERGASPTHAPPGTAAATAHRDALPAPRLGGAGAALAPLREEERAHNPRGSPAPHRHRCPPVRRATTAAPVAVRDGAATRRLHAAELDPQASVARAHLPQEGAAHAARCGGRAGPAGGAPIAARRQPTRTALGIDLFPHGPLAIEVVPWGLTPSRDTITVVAKATCDLTPEGRLVPRAVPEPPSGEALLGTRCVYPSDLVPYKVRADVVLVGHAVAPGGSATSMEVAFRFGSGDSGFARRILVFGDRTWVRAKGPFAPTAPEPFVRMPLAFDRAFGGPGFAPNTAGLGHHDPMHRGPVPLPNLEDPDQVLRTPRQCPPPAACSPIPLAWKDRWADKHESGLCLADALDWTRFQAAPAPQQLAFLRGDEPFAIAGLSARHPAIEGSLPGLRARCFAEWRGLATTGGPPPAPARFEEVALRLDTVVFDVDAMKVSLVWRGAVPVDDERAPGIQGLYLLADPLGAETPLADARVKVLRP